MTKVYLLFISTFLITSIFAQSNITLNGQFFNSRDTLIFHDDSISFSIMSNGGVIFPIEGFGTFNICNNILYIKTRHQPKKQDKVQFGDKVYIENKTLLFRINSIKSEYLNITLIGIINNSEFRTNKTVRKFLRKHKKFIYRERILEKML